MRASLVERRMTFWALASALATLGCCAVVVGARCWSGALSVPLGAGPKAVVGVLIALGAVAAVGAIGVNVRRRSQLKPARSSPIAVDRPAVCPLLWLEYRPTAGGALEVNGRASVSFAPGQSTAYLHVAFCPPFAHTPQVEVQVAWPRSPAESKAGAERSSAAPAARAEVTVGKLFPWGMRLDVKRTETSTRDERVELTFRASGQ